MNIGQIRFERDAEGIIGLRQGWNPSEINRQEREVIATCLLEIAENINRDRFEVDGGYVQFPIADYKAAFDLGRETAMKREAMALDIMMGETR